MSKRYFAYVRVSTVKQGERGSSLIEQKSAIEAYAARGGLSIVGWFQEMETAAKEGRRQFSQMMAQLRAGKADGLVIHKIDRGARNPRDWADIGELIDGGIDVRIVSDNFDLLSRGGRLSADIQAVVAADYIRNLRDEVKKGIYGRLKQGMYPFPAPQGYLNNGKGRLKTIDPAKGPLIRHLFERYATNTVGFEQLRHELAAMGLRTRAGYPLYDNNLTLILNNPFYAGVIRLGTTGETFPGAHEPMITKELFERVQRILRGKTVSKAKTHRFVLRQLVKCGACARRTLTGEFQKSHIYYRCHGPTCQRVSWRGDVLEGIVLASITRIRLSERGLGDLKDLVEDEYQAHANDARRLASSLALRLKNLDERVTRLTDLLIDNAIDRATFTARKEKFLLERQSILEALKRGDRCSPLKDLFEMFELNNRQLLRYETLLDDEKREILEIVCSNFSICGKNPVFTLRSPYLEIAEMEDFLKCAPCRDNVRTQHIFDVLKNIAEKEIDAGTYISAPKSLKSPSPRRQPEANAADFKKAA